MTSSRSPRVLVVGAGLAGAACARALVDSGTDVEVAVLDRGRVPGGRLASRRMRERDDARVVDLGAPVFTARPDTGFAHVVDEWLERGVARVWTDRLSSAGAVRGGRVEDVEQHPQHVGVAGQRSLVEDLLRGLDVRQETLVGHVAATDDGARASGESVDETADVVVLAMPDPQAARLLDETAVGGVRLAGPDGWLATVTVVLEYAERAWPERMHAVRLGDDDAGRDAVDLVADDGDRRGDDAPVLVVHSSHGLAARHLDDPDGAIDPVSRAVADALGLETEPVSSSAHRWRFAQSSDPHDEPFALAGSLAVCGDGWGGHSSTSSAWESGAALGRELASRLA